MGQILDSQERIMDAVRTLIAGVCDEDLDREGLKETPYRVMNAFTELLGGYNTRVENLLKTFNDSCDEMVLVTDIDFVSVCEHHLLPFTGVAHVGYIPEGSVVGLSKIPRLVDCFARRLQIQERLTYQIGSCLFECVKPKGVGVVMEAHHSCVSCRGVRKKGAKMVTSSLFGAFKDDPSTRAEFLQLVRS
jgi:GTP cyclohydrolase IA